MVFYGLFGMLTTNAGRVSNNEYSVNYLCLLPKQVCFALPDNVDSAGTNESRRNKWQRTVGTWDH